mmetsp:Transcript_1322/g.3104  ORF Transcript_1322/g.3104 Transcript_1322/m.3104 type:complete len:104 (+) Transcript_1322:90-401(+)
MPAVTTEAEAAKIRRSRKTEELLAAALTAHANASCKALKRRILQRVRKKLGLLLPDDEFQQAMETLRDRRNDLDKASLQSQEEIEAFTFESSLREDKWYVIHL